MVKYINKETNLLTDENGASLKKLSEAESNLLLEFIAHRGQCLSRERLISAAWPDTIVVENSLNMAIKKLRAVGINIETIPRKGYTLVDSDVKLISEKEQAKQFDDSNTLSTSYINKKHTSSSPEHRPPSDKQSSFRRKLMATVVIIYLLLLIVINLILESAKPNIKCYEYKQVKVCTTDDHFESTSKEVSHLPPGTYIYGKRFDDEEGYQFIPVKE
ncbi:winged helix-turn-helix domain-containing protein [Vibrio alginolyticus]|uniref:winged helix-turn-helix domain-containing protein n=1 Tax=Vibrio alginolyticus TaxID=663 RepID=UPI0015F4EDD9|nr:winged helix-turn-helix domain-containing protein [Vibrio alginolyticus]